MAAPASNPGSSRLFTRVLRAGCVGVLISLGGLAASGAKWAPVDPKELAEAKPRVDPEAGAEILLREVSITHAEVDVFIRSHHVRVKIFTERGLQDFAKIDLPYDSKTEIRDLAVRTIKPDGTTIELTRKDFYNREITKVGKEREKVKSFSPAGLQPGAILEYTYEELTEGWSWYVPMHFQSAFPARVVRFKFRPIQASELNVRDQMRLSARAFPFNCPDQPLKQDNDGFYPFEMRNVPAAKYESFQPPELECQSAILVCYTMEQSLAPKPYWAKFGADLHERMLRETKATKVVRSTLDRLIAPGDSAELKLRKLYDYCRSQLVNRYSDGAQFTRAQRAKFKRNENASDTLTAGHGSGEDINIAFVALARAAGFDARLVACNDRSFVFFNPGLTEPFSVSDLIASVQWEGRSGYFDPGVRYLPFATPHWRNAATAAIIAAPKDATAFVVPFSLPEVSQRKRRATLQLDTEGTLEGDVTVEYTGHLESFMKSSLDGKTPAERETAIREEIQENLKLAEVTDIKIENATDPLAPLKVVYHLRIPEYADRTGSRLFFQPAVFQKNIPSPFPEATRRTTIFFRNCYTHHDEIRITTPEDFELEAASAPPSLSLGAMGDYDVTVSLMKKQRTIIYDRTFTLRALRFLPAVYAPIKEAFEVIHERDAHTFTLKRESAAGAASESPTSAAVGAPPVSNPPVAAGAP